MKIIVECENCGNKVEISSETLGNVAYFEDRLLEHDFNIFDVEIEKELQQDSVSDVDEVDAKLKEIRIDCDRCDEYICLSF